MGYVTALLLLALVGCCRSVSITNRCRSDQFYNTESGKCTMCLVCTGNQIPQRMCHGEVNTVCGPLPGFLDFLQPQNPSKPTESSVHIPENPDKTSELPTTSTVSASDKWYTITIVLGILVMTCVISVVAVLIICVFSLRKHDREIIYKAEYSSPCSTMVVNNSPIVKTTLLDQISLVSEQQT